MKEGKVSCSLVLIEATNSIQALVCSGGNHGIARPKMMEKET